MEKPDLSVIMLTNGGAESLQQALARLEVQTYPAGRFEVLIIDLGDSPETREMLDRYTAGAPIRTRCFGHTEESPASGRNLGLREAVGRWVLFLDQDLLAGPQLVESHVRAQEQHGGNVAILGRISLHPQVDPKTFTKWDEVYDERAAVEEALPLPYLEWRAFNLSLPRQTVLDAGGFDEAFPVAGLEDLELARRLEQGGLQGFYVREACAHAWRTTNVSRERQRAYGEGYTLARLLEKTQSKELRRHFLGHIPRFKVAMTALTLPVCRWVCRSLASHTAPFRAACQYASRHAFLRGYRDAVAGIPPR